MEFMKNGFLQAIGVAIVSFIVAGCAASTQNTGARVLSRGDYEKALSIYQGQTSKNPTDAAAWQALGIAYYHLDSLIAADKALAESARLRSDDARTTLYQGLTAERREDFDRARQLYRRFVARGGSQPVDREIRQRLRFLEDERLRKSVSRAIASEKSINVEKIPENTAAIVQFDADSLPPEYRPLGRGIAELIYGDLAKVSQLTLVERLELSQLRKELDLSQSQFADKYHSPRIGRLVGAARVIAGSLSSRADRQIVIDAGVIDVGPGMAKYPPRQEGAINDFFRLQKKLSLDLIKSLGYEITPELRNAIDKPATESMLALVAYSRGLEHVDQGRYALAEAEFRAAVKEDPNFGAAKEALTEFEGLSDYNGKLNPIGSIALGGELSIAGEEKPPVDRNQVIDRLRETTNGVAPENQNPTVTPRNTRGTIVVRGRAD